MKQQRLGLSHSNKRTRRREFLGEIERVVPWTELVALVAPFMPEGRRGRPPFAVKPMLRIHFMQQWFNLSDTAMEDALHDVPVFREFAGLGGWDDRLPDESTILIVPPPAGAAQTGPADPTGCQSVAHCQGPAAQERHGGGCHTDRCAEFHQERLGRARPGDEAEQEGQPVVLWHAGTHRRGRPLGPSAHRAGHDGQLQRCGGGQQPVARARDRSLG